MYQRARDLLFKLDAETAHELTLRIFQRLPRASAAIFKTRIAENPVELMGLKFRNRIGLAAGLDKNGECIAAWDALGFGFVEVGTVTPRPQPGNPRPRLFRLPEHQALINRLGFNNKGVDHLVERVRATPRRCTLGVNIGKNFDTPLESAGQDYTYCLRKVYDVADYVTVNISSPNTQNLRDLQREGPLRHLLARLRETREELADRSGRRLPLLVKIAPDLNDEQITALARAVREEGMDGLIATNTTVDRTEVQAHPRAAETGGLSGAPLRTRALSVLRKLRSELGADFPLIGVGGIGSAADAAERYKAGADLLQIYTGFIYRGPPLIAECAGIR
ncbi:MAG: quinone-dependent dihydroorotate dehydrogenase [Pseudomonadota bacterium]